MESTREQRMELFQFLAELLAKKAEAGIPESGSFQKTMVRGTIKGTECHSLLGVEASCQSATERCVSIGVYREGNDELVSNLLFCGTGQEMCAWLQNPEGLERIVEAYGRLEERLLYDGK